MKKCSLFSALLIFAAFTACKVDDVPVMGDHSVLEVDISELSGLCFNRDASALLACGDDGDVKTVSFDGKATPLWSFDSDMEGITIDPASGNLYIAIEGRQEVHMLAAPDYDAQVLLFPVSEAVEGNYRNNGIKAVEYYRDDILFVGSQQDANIWQYRLDGTVVSKISLSAFASEIAGLCYEPEADLLWVSDSRQAKLFMCTTDVTLIASYDIPFIENAESVCVDRKRGCIWVGSDEDSSKIYRIDFRF